ncbi:hypothetical protein BU25DRAFT_451383 [Macroventuria anomochaeta]|uniref:Uncharacterized protein n=1 Tax=Macroventuria anomochaeta TaxID=301207 RepID=A0ACB6RMZ1_9PLEO|nr:uncharacterized protein BU25DRAFT_451383 [Macroventuria anomochaeta]KAF2623406.1 hypothetical protein BU25DRAFT_451383 [Macroventuria anomochaeta]
MPGSIDGLSTHLQGSFPIFVDEIILPFISILLTSLFPRTKPRVCVCAYLTHNARVLTMSKQAPDATTPTPVSRQRTLGEMILALPEELIAEVLANALLLPEAVKKAQLQTRYCPKIRMLKEVFLDVEELIEHTLFTFLEAPGRVARIVIETFQHRQCSRHTTSASDLVRANLILVASSTLQMPFKITLFL